MLEDNLAMAARLSAAGGAVDIRVYPESRHGFTTRLDDPPDRGVLAHSACPHHQPPAQQHRPRWQGRHHWSREGGMPGSGIDGILQT